MNQVHKERRGELGRVLHKDCKDAKYLEEDDEERRVEETSPSDDVAEMHKVMRGSNWPDK